MDNLEELMEHITYFYEPIRSAYDDSLEFTVFLKDGRWEITNNGETIPVFGTTEYMSALGFLVEVNADIALFHGMVHEKVCTEGTLRRLQLKKIEELVGKESVDKNEEAWAEFTKGLAGIIDKEVNKTTLEIV